ncbi:endonuclease domain-containing protein [Ottowia caeni]|uniref:endonuclease domain-containing protein n=1 Tax=Ottowia caeni TaxID=2870339 RepID=UPI003D73E6FF|nr:endonuclease domain-containing protein [Ottowia caeni]
MSLPYNQNLKERARELRKAGLLHEALLWNQLKRKSFRGLDFDRQKIIGNYIVDFFCAEKGVVIEADGASHDGKDVHDAQRDDYLRALGLTVIRISAKDILQDMEGVLELLGHNETLVGEAEPPRPSGTPPTEGNWEAVVDE